MKDSKVMNNFYQLPQLKYDYSQLSPLFSGEQLEVHHSKHHRSYVDKANQDLRILDDIKNSEIKIDEKALLKDLSFNIGGHVLHSLFWDNLTPKSDINLVDNELKDKIVNQYGNMGKFKDFFLEAAISVEGSGWAALSFCKLTHRPLVMQIEKHNLNIYPMFKILLIIDAWEHAYYIDYKNKRKDYVESFWEFIDWKEVSKRYREVRDEA